VAGDHYTTGSTYGAMTAIDILLAVAGHTSTMLCIVGGLHLALFATRRSSHPTLKRAETPISAALFPAGILMLVTFLSYVVELLVGGRGMVYSPYFIVFRGGLVPAVATFVSGLTMGTASFSATSQLGRKLPWSVMAGVGLGVLTGGGVYSLASGAGLGGAVVMGGCAALALVLFMVGYWLTDPWKELARTLGDITAFSPAILFTSLGCLTLGIISGMGLVVL